MTRIFIAWLAAALACAAFGAEKKVALKDLPAAVQKTVQDQSKGAEIKGISQETEKGVTVFEVEMMVNGKHRDLNIDTMGTVVEVEDETAIESIPPAARAAIEKKAAGGKIDIVETITKGAVTLYEATYTAKSGKKHEVVVKPDG